MSSRWWSGRYQFLAGLLLGCVIGMGAVRLFYRGEDLVIRVEALATPTVAVVYVDGAVARPGLYEVASDTRIAEVVERAGLLPEADLARVPMAQRVQDGQTITIPLRTARAAASEGQDAVATTGNERIDINRASAAELERLPGVGPALAQRIVAYRETHGPFRSVEDLANIAGISERMVAQWTDLITVGNGE